MTGGAYPWAPGQVFTVWRDRDMGDYSPAYWVPEIGRSFSSPEELVLCLTASAPAGWSLDLQLPSRNASEFIDAWRLMQAPKGV